MCGGGGRGGGVGRVMLVGEWAGARLDGECSLTTLAAFIGAHAVRAGGRWESGRGGASLFSYRIV